MLVTPHLECVDVYVQRKGAIMSGVHSPFYFVTDCSRSLTLDSLSHEIPRDHYTYAFDADQFRRRCRTKVLQDRFTVHFGENKHSAQRLTN